MTSSLGQTRAPVVALHCPFFSEVDARFLVVHKLFETKRFTHVGETRLFRKKEYMFCGEHGNTFFRRGLVSQLSTASPSIAVERSRERVLQNVFFAYLLIPFRNPENLKMLRNVSC